MWTYTRTADSYAVHELLRPGEDVTPCEPPDVRHGSEAVGRDILCDDDGFWRSFAEGSSGRGRICVHAGSIVHRGTSRINRQRKSPVLMILIHEDPCIGYVFNEPTSDARFASPQTARKIVVLGDTSSPASLTLLIVSIPGRLVLLVHEATDAHIPESVDRKLAAKRSKAVVERVTTERGHSTPQDAGKYAGLWGAERLVMNHIGARYADVFHLLVVLFSDVMRSDSLPLALTVTGKCNRKWNVRHLKCGKRRLLWPLTHLG